MATVEQVKGGYIHIKECANCNWYDKPINGANFPKKPRSICPDCGCELKSVVGRFIIKRTKNLLTDESEVIGFERKETKPNVPKPKGTLNIEFWPRNHRESEIIKQQNDLHDYFHWGEAGIGFAVASLFWGVCFHLWGA